jgi:hypothetical protein
MTDHTNPMRQNPIVPGDLFARHQTITGLRQLADFLEANPAVPVHEYGREYTIYTRGSDKSGRAQVDRIAALLGVTPDDETNRGGHYTATKTFGRISYRVIHIPAQARQAHHARASYETNIRLDEAA